MNLKEQTFFFKRLAFLSNAHIPLTECLEVLHSQAPNKKQGKVLHSILADVRAGQTFSRALGKFPHVFTTFSISIITVGESSGTLAKTLEYLAEELRKKQLLKAKVVGACIYPLVIAAATLGITVFLIIFLFPKITPIFKSLRATLPLSTRIVMGASNFLMHYGLLLAVGLIALGIFGAWILKRSARLQLIFDRVILRIPLVGTMLTSYTISNMCRTLGLLLASGLTLSRSVVITAEASTNLIYKRELEAMERALARGGQMSAHLVSNHMLFPSTLSHMVAVGERSGTLSQTLLYVSELYDSEVDEFAKNLSTLIEPALMVVMGVMVGFIAISIITPIYAITQNLH